MPEREDAINSGLVDLFCRHDTWEECMYLVAEVTGCEVTNVKL